MGDWYVKVDKCPNVRSMTANGGGVLISEFVDFQMGDTTIKLEVTPPNDFKYLNLDNYKKSVQEEYKEMVLGLRSMPLPDRAKYFGGAVVLDEMLENHPDPVGAYQRWKAKQDSAKEMTIEEIEAQLGYKIKVVGKEDK